MIVTWRNPAGRGTGLARAGSDVARYGFAPRGSTAGPVIFDDLLGAVRALLAADAVLGPATLGTADDAGANRVYTGGIPEGGMTDPATGAMGVAIVVLEVSALPRWTTTDAYLDDATIQVSVFAPDDPDRARSLGKRARAVLSPRRGYTPLLFADGVEATRLPGRSALVKDPAKGPRGADVWHQHVDVTFKLGRSLS